jgi:AcrR family transcriptional regulator
VGADVNRSRTYRSELRDEQAQATRDRIVTAARALFLEQGYARTTIKAVAETAGVAEMTVYTAVRDKKGLLEAVIGSAIGGPDFQPQADGFARLEHHPTQHDRLRAWTELTCDILARTSPIHAVIRSAGDKEPFAVELRATLLEARLDANRQLVRTFLAGALRPGISFEDAAQRFTALTSPEFHHLTVVELGWPPRRHMLWLADALERELLVPPPA